MVSNVKKDLVKRLVGLVGQSTVVAVLNIETLPARQFQNMRESLRKEGVSIVVARKRLLQKALTDAGQEHLVELNEKMRGMPALLFSSSNPFTLAAIIQKNKSEAPAKAGQVAPKDIVVKAGATNFAPGPIISQLASVGIKTKVEGGKLAIINDTVVAKEGDTISAALAENLKRLDINPMEVGLDLVAAWESGFIFSAKDLFIDEAQYASDFATAASWAFNLAMEIGHVTSETVEPLLQKSFREAKAVAVEAAVLEPETTGDVLAKAEREASSVKSDAKL